MERQHRRNGDVWDGYEYDERNDETGDDVDAVSFTRRATLSALIAMAVALSAAFAIGIGVHWLVGWP